jgi:GNAT superfamily N-acetyltransferase
MMKIPKVSLVGLDDLSVYAQVPIAYRVDKILRVVEVSGGLGGIKLVESEVNPPYVKDYDAHENSGPLSWPTKFDVSRWAIFLARDEAGPAGGATVAFDTPGVNMLAGRRDLAVLWDVRVRPDVRRRGIGTLLFHRAAEWARQQACRQLKIETQNVNLPACRFYAAQGCHLGEINRYAYAGCPEVAHEVMLIWYLGL